MVTVARSAPPPFDRLVVFGDSLSDTGNAGRFSNGSVWVEYVARQLGVELRPSSLGGGNYAVGGARASDLRRQVDAFLSKADAKHGRSLIVVYGGGNDLRATLYGAPPEQTVHDAVLILRAIIEDLAAAGARHILVPNLPDVGLAAEASGQGPERSRLATELSHAFNLALNMALDGVAARHRNLRLYRVNAFALHHAIVKDPAAFGFKNVRDPCAPGCPDPEHWLLWDRTHPTTAAHLRLAEAALRVLDGESGPVVKK